MSGCTNVWIERHGRLEKSDVVFDSDAQLLQVIQRIIRSSGRRIDESSPLVDSRLPDGSRVNAVIPPLSIDGPQLCIRRFTHDDFDAHSLIAIGSVDEIMMRVVDSVMALPALVLALTIAAVLGSGLVNATIAIAVVTAPTYTRLVRGQVLAIKQNDYVVAAQSIGAPTWRVLARHLLPNTFSPVIVQASLGIGFAIILESSMSFIGLGAMPPTPSWGNMVQVGFQFLEIAPWCVIAPATAIFLAVLGFNMLGDGLRDALDPQSGS